SWATERPGRVSPVALLARYAEIDPTIWTPSVVVGYKTGPPLTPLIATPSIKYALRHSCQALTLPEKKHKVHVAIAGYPSHPTSTPTGNLRSVGRSGIGYSGN